MTSTERASVVERLRHLPVGVLESVLSSEDVYLGFQAELLGLSAETRHKRLAELVALTLGDSLLASRVVRSELGRSTDRPVPSSWKPGSAVAVQLCRELQLPISLAGRQIGPTPDPVTQLPGPPVLPPLQDYQHEVFTTARALLTSGESALLSLPTGGGKTRVAVELLLDWHLSRGAPCTTVWVAHTEELCDQAAVCVQEVWRSRPSPAPSVLIRAWGRHTSRLTAGERFEALRNGDSHAVIVTTPLTLPRVVRLLRDGDADGPSAAPSLMVIDEAHRAAAPTYHTAVDSLRRWNPDVSVLGLSATPVRETYASHPYDGTRELTRLFKHLVEPIETLGTTSSPTAALQLRGILAELEVVALWSKAIPPRDAARAIAHVRHASAVRQPALAFLPTAADAKVLGAYLTELGLRAITLTANTPGAIRESAVNALRAQAIDVLCNCELLTTGFDAPAVSELFLGRSTESPVLYKQIVGRGLRGPAFGGSATCKLYLCGVSLAFPGDPNTSEFARLVWGATK